MKRKNLKSLPKLTLKEKWALSNASLAFKAEEFLYLENGQKFSFKDHEYLFEVYTLDHDDIRIRKATQMGFTTWAFVRHIDACEKLLPLGVMYFFPTKEDVTDFSKARIDNFLKYNKDMHIVDDKETKNVGLKHIGKSFMYFRGMRSPTAVKSVPADALVFDEVDEADPVKLDMALKRIDHSDFKWKTQLSNPTIPDFGIDRSFKESDQRYWHVKCSHCGAWVCLDKEFPKCLKRVNEYKVIRICKRCKKEFDIRGQGQWVPDYPNCKDKRGYHISQLYSHYVDPNTILTEFETVLDLKQFYRLRLGLPYAGPQDKIDKNAILNLPREEIFLKENDMCFMGIDQGNDLHIVILKKMGSKKLGLYDIIVIKDFEDIDDLLKKNKIFKCVIDALPEKRKATELRNRNKSKVHINYYNDNQKGSYKWNDADGIVQEDRTESLDGSHALITKKKLIINKMINPADLEVFAEHCSNMARIKETADDGSQRYIWVRTGADHFRHALNYACIASSRSGGRGIRFI